MVTIISEINQLLLFARRQILYFWIWTLLVSEKKKFS